MSNHTERYKAQLVMAQANLTKTLDRNHKVWNDEDASKYVTRAAELLGLEPGQLNGYLEVWTHVFDVMECEAALDLEARNQRGEGL